MYHIGKGSRVPKGRSGADFQAYICFMATIGWRFVKSSKEKQTASCWDFPSGDHASTTRLRRGLPGAGQASCRLRTASVRMACHAGRAVASAARAITVTLAISIIPGFRAETPKTMLLNQRETPQAPNRP